MATNRLQQINGEIHRELARLIPTLKDPRVSGMVSVVRVDTTRDLSLCRVFISAMQNKDEVMKGLRSAGGFLRKEIGNSLGLRATPKFEFIDDASIERGVHIMGILRNLEPDNDGGENERDS